MNDDLQLWDEVAGRWDKKVATDGTLRTVLFENSLTDLLDTVENLHGLDAGCGNGYLTDMLSEEGAAMIGIDGSKAMIDAAIARYPGRDFRQIDLLKPLPFPDASFDFVLCSMVLMHLVQVDTFLSESRRILKDGGQLVISILHPCFNQPVMKLKRGLWSKIAGGRVVGEASDYFDQPSNRRFESQVGEHLTHYHRTLEEYSRKFRDNGLTIAEIREPHDLPEEFLRHRPELEYATRLPRFILFKTIKPTV
ncbi:MAG: class I SAM-dependent methyltransferase [Candidatus Saccharibacteria bacterium]